MKCLSKYKINLYVEGELGDMESSIVRDHLLVCKNCNKIYSELLFLEDLFKESNFMEPPDFIEKRVMSSLNKRKVTYWLSLASTLILLFLTGIIWLYTHFNFASNQALNALSTGKSVISSLISSIVDFTKGIFSFTYTLYRVTNKILELVVPGNPAIFICVCLIFIALSIFFAYKVLKRKES